MAVSVPQGMKVGKRISDAVEEQVDGVSVDAYPLTDVPDHVTTAERGGLYIQIRGKTSNETLTARDEILHRLDESGIEWESNDRVAQQTDAVGEEGYHAAIATEALTEDHITVSP